MSCPPSGKKLIAQAVDDVKNNNLCSNFVFKSGIILFTPLHMDFLELFLSKNIYHNSLKETLLYQEP